MVVPVNTIPAFWFFGTGFMLDILSLFTITASLHRSKITRAPCTITNSPCLLFGIYTVVVSCELHAIAALTRISHHLSAATTKLHALSSLYSLPSSSVWRTTPRVRSLLTVSHRICRRSTISPSTMLRDFVSRFRRKENPPQSSFSKGGRKSKRASPVLSAVEGLVCLDITSISVLSRPNLVSNTDQFYSAVHLHPRSGA